MRAGDSTQSRSSSLSATLSGSRQDSNGRAPPTPVAWVAHRRAGRPAWGARRASAPRWPRTHSSGSTGAAGPMKRPVRDDIGSTLSAEWYGWATHHLRSRLRCCTSAAEAAGDMPTDGPHAGINRTTDARNLDGDDEHEVRDRNRREEPERGAPRRRRPPARRNPRQRHDEVRDDVPATRTPRRSRATPATRRSPPGRRRRG